MTSTHIIKARVSPEMKQRVRTLADSQLITESIWLRRLVAGATHEVGHGALSLPESRARLRDLLADDGERVAARVCIRLRPDDRLLLRDRASARNLASATYLSILVRAHLRHLAPLPTAELKAMKHAVAELSAIGRNLNQLARAANQGGRAVTRTEDLRAVIKVCETLRDEFRRLIRINVESWEVGHASGQN